MTRLFYWIKWLIIGAMISATVLVTGCGSNSGSGSESVSVTQEKKISFKEGTPEAVQEGIKNFTYIDKRREFLCLMPINEDSKLADGNYSSFYEALKKSRMNNIEISNSPRVIWVKGEVDLDETERSNPEEDKTLLINIAYYKSTVDGKSYIYPGEIIIMGAYNPHLNKWLYGGTDFVFDDEGDDDHVQAIQTLRHENGKRLSPKQWLVESAYAGILGLESINNAPYKEKEEVASDTDKTGLGYISYKYKEMEKNGEAVKKLKKESAGKGNPNSYSYTASTGNDDQYFGEYIQAKDIFDVQIVQLSNDINAWLNTHSNFQGAESLMNRAKELARSAGNRAHRLSFKNMQDNQKKEDLMNLFILERDRANGLYKGMLDSANGGDFTSGFQQGTKASYAFDDANADFNNKY